MKMDLFLQFFVAFLIIFQDRIFKISCHIIGIFKVRFHLIKQISCPPLFCHFLHVTSRSEERRVGKECRVRGSKYAYKEKKQDDEDTKAQSGIESNAALAYWLER